MSGTFDPEATVDAMSAAVGLAIDDAHRPGVVRFLAIAAEFAAIVDAAPLDERELAPAPVYTPPET
ncbi:hypothetical protein DLJ53_09000 [Acuticoccus sediminis]|uniref:DUF4089 domain-containing protein n=1 Tax=Acuticoccus sediminis TaxID=2184697 RepID=A0A8B2NV10_9HYPH|nr:DUF4089 domain-containing protein [Acuticoccus sediminis]RAI01553.1 hypothetical protein DLJ53_09000 [Acuticoccus sediminis]